MNIIARYIVKNDCYQNNINRVDSRYVTFQERGPLGLVLHSVGSAQPKAIVFADGWNVPNKEVAVHAVLQGDGTVYQCMPWNFRGWHVGGSANNTHAGVEMTEPACITYIGGDKFTCPADKLAEAQAFVLGCFNTAVELFAEVCKEYNLNPLADGVILSHKEAGQRGIGSGHTDPEHLWKGLNMSLNMNKFRQEVYNKMQESQWVTKDEVNEMIQKAVAQSEAKTHADIVRLNSNVESLSQSIVELNQSLSALNNNFTGAIRDLVEADNEIRASIPNITTYYYLKDVPKKYYRPTIDKLIDYGYLAGKGGSGEDRIIDLTEDSVRVLVYLDNAGIWDMLHNGQWVVVDPE